MSETTPSPTRRLLCRKCRYECTEVIAAERGQCPECGASVSELASIELAVALPPPVTRRPLLLALWMVAPLVVGTAVLLALRLYARHVTIYDRDAETLRAAGALGAAAILLGVMYVWFVLNPMLLLGLGQNLARLVGRGRTGFSAVLLAGVGYLAMLVGAIVLTTVTPL